MQLQKGQKIKIQDYASAQIEIHVSAKMKTGEADVTCFGIDAAGKLSDDRYFVFYNQTQSPAGEITMRAGEDETIFSIRLSALPDTIQKLVVTIAAEGAASMKDIARGSLSLMAGGVSVADFPFTGESFQQEKALILCQLYKKDSLWRLSVVADGFNGGLSALLAHFGGQEVPRQTPAAPAPPAAPSPAPAGNVPPPAAGKPAKISLKKSGETHRINLSKNSGEIHANLNWNTGSQRRGLFGGQQGIDLDLACMYRLKSGHAGVVQALGNSFGNAADYPFILLDQDDRTGASQNGENMYFKKPDLIDFAIVFAFIYEGAPNWRQTDATVLLKQGGAPDIEIHIDSANDRDRFCVFASLTSQSGHLEVKREDRFFSSHRDVDKFYGFGFRWAPGRK